MSRVSWAVSGCAWMLAVACGATDGAPQGADLSHDPSAPDADRGGRTEPDASSTPVDASRSSADAARWDASDAATDVAPGPIQCGMQLPSGAASPPPLPQYAGTCPALAAYPSYTQLGARRFLVVKPAVIAPSERLPVLFAWHWLGGSPEDMVDKLGLVTATETLRFIAVVPEPKDSETFRWPFTSALANDGRMDEEYTFFDDMLACVAQSERVDEGCISSLGISAGALFTAQLVIGRGERLASFVSLSGGVGGLARAWSTPAHSPPGVVLWGGDDDEYPKQLPIMHFDELSANLEAGMAQDHLGLVECIHNCGHTVPPFETPASGVRFEALYDFVRSHPYGLPAGTTRYQGGLPDTFPAWCGLGQGAAVARTGVCP